MKRNISNPIWIIIIVLLSLSFLGINSYTTSPIYENNISFDSGVYKVIGRSWGHGLIPYRDLFDIKGPFIFLVDRLGYDIFGNDIGIFCIQIIFFFASLLIIYRFLSRSLRPMQVFTCIIAFCFMLAVSYSGGNLVDEFILPFLICSFLMIYEWIENISNENVDHKPLNAVIYGLSFGVALLSRLTNALPLCIAICIIVMILIKHKRWINLQHNALAFLIGAALVILPFLLYFYVNDAFSDWWNETIVFGFKYFGDSEQGSFSFGKYVAFFINNLPVFILLAAVIINYMFRKNENSWISLIVWGAVSMVSVLWIMKSRGYPHYSTIFTPYIVVAMLELYKIHNKYFVKFINLAILICVIVLGGKSAYKCYLQHWGADKKTLEVYNVVMEKIPSEDRNNTLLYNSHTQLYLNYSIIPCCKYFCLQDENSSISDEFREGLRHSVKCDKIKWIVVTNEARSIGDLLKKSYVKQFFLNSKIGDISLYRLNDIDSKNK